MFCKSELFSQFSFFDSNGECACRRFVEFRSNFSIWLRFNLMKIRVNITVYYNKTQRNTDLSRPKFTIKRIQLCRCNVFSFIYSFFVWLAHSQAWKRLIKFVFHFVRNIGMQFCSLILWLSLLSLNSINFWLFSVIIKLLPCLVLTVISFILIRVLCQAAKRKVKLKGYNQAASASNINTVLNGHR